MANNEGRSDGFTAVEDEYAGYTVFDQSGEKIGKVDDLFLDENDKPEYIGVKMGFFGTRSTLVPLDACTVDKGQGFIEVNQPKSVVKDAPNFDDDSEITPDYERRVREQYGLSPSEDSGERGAYASGRDDEAASPNSDGDQVSTEGKAGMVMGDRDASGDFREHQTDREGTSEGSDLEDEDELRVQRSEEELRAGVREREAGKLNVRKRVRTERERIAVPKKREEVTVDRVPVNEPAADGQIGESEVSVPVVEEEVVVGKQAVVKEEIRVKKDVVQDEEIVEEDVRKEEVDIDDTSGSTGRRDR